MQHKNLIDLLAKQGLGKDGETWTVPSGVAATVYLSFAEESLIIDRVARLEVSTDVAVVTTARRERYAFELETLRALRFVAEK